MAIRKIAKTVTGLQTVDGAGVHLVRVLGHDTVEDFDPFLMLDSFDLKNPDDYIKGKRFKLKSSDYLDHGRVVSHVPTSGGNSMKNKTIGVFVGSLRKQSYSKQIAEIISAMMPENIEMRMMDIGSLPIFNQDFDDENKTPKEWTVFRDSVEPLDGFLFVTPEYNRSVPPVLKNAIDIGSRPYDQNLWNGKPGTIVSVSPGKLSGFGANHHLRQSLSFLNVYTMQQPEAYIGNVEDLLNDAGTLTDEGTRNFLQNFVEAFVNWIKEFDE